MAATTPTGSRRLWAWNRPGVAESEAAWPAIFVGQPAYHHHPRHHALATPAKPACIMADSGEVLRYDELDRQANQAAHRLRALGLHRGDVLAVMIDNEAALFPLAWAAQRTGLHLTSVSTKSSVADLAYILNDCGAKVLVASEMTVHRFGGTVVIMERFDAEEAPALIERYRITHSTWVPTHFVRLLRLPKDVRARHDHGSMRAAIHAAAPCPVLVKQAMIDWWGPVIYEYYSGTETCGVTALSADEWLAKPGSVGKAILGIVEIVDEDGNELPTEQVDNVYFADGLQFEYHNDPVKTAAAYDHRG
ncbi:AMP-binding protein [Niveispirillum sp. SYP-B3756]|uniref:AMP-binding protein n=1 Tax=Niveispirillum sp. SYP-B3756 TaxID=2662178 RepID=UPI0024945F06|nr:AMP-binding protein [Niveispirillum sp. SYP-B3756]